MAAKVRNRSQEVTPLPSSTVLLAIPWGSKPPRSQEITLGLDTVFDHGQRPAIHR